MSLPGFSHLSGGPLELKSDDVPRQVLAADIVINADDAALNKRPEAFNPVLRLTVRSMPIGFGPGILTGGEGRVIRKALFGGLLHAVLLLINCWRLWQGQWWGAATAIHL